MKQKILNLIYKIFAIFARIYLKRQKPIIIGVTGSVGKTSCRLIVAQTLQQIIENKNIYTSPKNYNSEIGIICSIFQVEDYKPSIIYLAKLFFLVFFKSFFGNKKYDFLVLEYGVDKPKDMDFMLGVAKPQISIFTKLDFIHVANFKDLEELGNEKSKLLFATKKMVFLNKTDEFQEKIFSKIENIQKYYFCDKKVEFEYILENDKILTKIGKYKTNLLGAENQVYFELGVKIAEKLGCDIENTVFNFDLPTGRFNILEGINNSKIIDSSYNAGPGSMIAMIKNAVELQKNLLKDYNILFVLGDMREIGEISEQKHKEVFALASKYGEIFSVGSETKKYFGEHLGNYKYSREAGKALKNFLENNKDKKYLILFKGSQNTIFLEEAIKQILKDKSDENLLVRQEKYRKKEDF